MTANLPWYRHIASQDKYVSLWDEMVLEKKSIWVYKKLDKWFRVHYKRILDNSDHLHIVVQQIRRENEK